MASLERAARSAVRQECSTFARRGTSTAACGRSRARTRERTCSSPCASSRRRRAPGSRSTSPRCRGPSRARAGRAVCSASRAIPRSSSTEPTTRPARAPSPRTSRAGPPFVLLFGAMSDKDVRGLARALFPLARAVVLTRPRIARAAPPDDLARRAGRARAPGAPRPDRRAGARAGPPPRTRKRPRHGRRRGGEPLPSRRGDGDPRAREETQAWQARGQILILGRPQRAGVALPRSPRK